MAIWSAEELPQPTGEAARLESDLFEYGYCVISNALHPASLESVRDRLLEQAEAGRTLGYEFRDHAELEQSTNQWVYMVVNKGKVFAQLFEHPLVVRLMTMLLGSEYQLSASDGRIVHPGNTPQTMHSGQWFIPSTVMPGERVPSAGAITRTDQGASEATIAEHPIQPFMQANVLWMLSDFTEANGATRVTLRSHWSGKQPDPAASDTIETVAAVAPAGSALVLDGRTWHGAGINQTNHSRAALATSYCVPQLRPMENYSLGSLPEVLTDASPALLTRLGRKPWSGYGSVGDPQAEFVDPETQVLGELKL